MNGFGFSIIAVVLFSVIICIMVIGSGQIPNDNHNPVVVGTNSIGCKKYSYKGDQYWKCPKKLDIDYIEERHSNGKTTSTRHVPVSNME